MPAAGAPTAVPASMPTSSRTASAAAGVHTRVPGAWAFRAAPAPDLVRRAVSGISRTNHVWVADTTAIRSGEGWLHRAVVIDLRSRRVVGWKASATLDASLTGNAVRMALHRRRPVAGRERVHHSDRGSTSTAWAFQALLRKAGITCSMGRPGTCMDKLVAETFFATLRGRAHPPAPLDFTCRCGRSHIRLCRNVAQPAPSARKPRLPQPRCLRSLPTVCPDRSQTIDCPINGCKSNRGVARWWDTAGVAWMMAMPPGRRRLLAPGSAEAVAEREKASFRARVEHPIRVIKRQFGHMEARYRGLAKNGSRLVTRFALANLWMARRTLVAGSAASRPRAQPMQRRRAWTTRETLFPTGTVACARSTRHASRPLASHWTRIVPGAALP